MIKFPANITNYPPKSGMMAEHPGSHSSFARSYNIWLMKVTLGGSVPRISGL